MNNKKVDKRFTQIDELLVAARKIQISKLEKEKIETEKHLERLDKKLQEIIINIKKQRIIKKTKGDYKNQIICPCGNVYHTNNDPYDRLKVKRPLCKKCKRRLK